MKVPKLEPHENGVEATIEDYPDDPEKLRAALHAIPNLVRVSVFQNFSGRFPSLSFLEGLSRVQSLYITSTPKGADCSAVRTMRGLRSIGVGTAAWLDCTVLPDLPHLSRFSSWGSKLHRPEALGECKLLEELKPVGFRANDCKLFAKLPKLKKLRLWCCRIPSTDGLSECQGLEDLDLGRSTFKSLEGLRGLKHLPLLQMTYCSKVADPSPLADCTGLKSLVLDRCKFTLAGSLIAALPLLERLSAQGVTLGEDAQQIIAHHPTLKKVWLAKRYQKTFPADAKPGLETNWYH
jgi:Leucine-rich repeat (LRR) protein